MDYEEEQRYLQRLLEEVESNDELECNDSADSCEEDEIEEQNLETASEQDISEAENDILLETEDEEIICRRVPIFLGKDKKTKWRKHPGNKRVRTRAENLVTHLPGVKGVAREKKKFCDIWECFITEQMLELIVMNTNLNIELHADPLNRTYRKTDILEIKALLGLLYIAGKFRNNHLNARDLFRKNGTSLEIFRLTMSYERFKFLLAFIRFDDKRTRAERQMIDKLAPIRTFFEDFNSNLTKHYIMSNYCTVDEKLEAFRGRCGFKVYMPKKPNRYGIKIYALTDAKLAYTSNLEIYVGQQPQGPYQQTTKTVDLVTRLCRPIWGTNRNVTLDNFFTSKQLADTLLTNHKLTIIGTIRKNRPELPLEFTAPVKRPTQTSMFGFQDKCTIVSYIPKLKKVVLLMSTMHYEDDTLDQQTGKPNIILDYNSTKGGVDTVDKMCESYNCARSTNRWPMVIFYALLNIAGINAYTIYRCNSARTAQRITLRRTFLETMGMQLIEPHARRRAIATNIPRMITLRLREMFDITLNAQNNERSHGRCFYCDSKKSRKTKYSCYSCNKFMCLEHIKGICVECSGYE